MGRSNVSHSSQSISFVYPLLLLTTAHLWVLWYLPEGHSAAAFASFFLQQLSLVALYLLADNLLRSPRARFLLAGCATYYVGFVLFDAMLIRVTELSSSRALDVFVAGGWSTLTEIGLRPSRLVLLSFGLLAAFFTGGLVHRFVDRWRLCLETNRLLGAGAAAALITPILFVSEQTAARDGDGYLFRSLELPAYVQLFDTTTRSYRVDLDRPEELMARHDHLASVGPANNPRHVMFFLLESFRADAVDPKLSPTLHDLTRSSLHFENAYTEALFTPLSWNVLLLDRPVEMYLWPRMVLVPQEPGSWPLGVLDSAGYEIWISSSADLNYAGFLPYLLGENDPVNRLEMVDERRVRERWRRDDLATETLIEWVRSSNLEKPTFMMLQLDSTHWTYDFPPDAAVVEPYSAPLDMPVPLTTEEEFALLHNRYRNCVHHVDRKIGQVISALKERGIYDDTVIVVVADHAEGFAPGIQGHSALCSDTMRIPMMLKLPGVPPQRIERAASLRNVFPTLFDYLDIDDLEQGLMLGRSALPPSRNESELLVFAADGRSADLRLSDGTHVRFNVLLMSERAWFTPVGVMDERGTPLEDPWRFLEEIPWREMIEQRMHWSPRAEMPEVLEDPAIADTKAPAP